MRIYNTLSDKKELLRKPARGTLKLFVCGPTVYDYPHIGHAKTYVAFDVIVRYLRYRGFRVFYLQNITDVDDRIMERAKRSRRPPLEVAREFEHAYHEDMATLDITTVNRYARASEFIPAILNQVRTLLAKGFAYATASGVYFEVKKFPRYGRLSRQDLQALRPGWRIEPDPQKRDPLDFALWKLSREEPNWPSPWGAGRPGWHIEDTAITEKILGVRYDLHGGAVDLKFPHHESEIAQQEAASGQRPLVKIWMHAGFLLVGGEKMSKSLNNFITVRDFLKKYPPAALRFLLISQHYRSPINYTDRVAAQATQAIANVVKFLTKLRLQERRGKRLAAHPPASLVRRTKTAFQRAMDDDFNTPEALAAIFSLINTSNEQLWSLAAPEARLVRRFIEENFTVLGLTITPYQAPSSLERLAQRREDFRRRQNFPAADMLRQQIEDLGHAIEDTPAGPLITKKN